MSTRHGVLDDASRRASRTAPSRDQDFDVIIVGAGVIGACMACTLLARKVCAPGRVALIDERSAGQPALHADWGLRVFALSRASQRLLTLSGVWQALPPDRLFAYEQMCVWSAAQSVNGPGALRFDCAEIGEPDLGHIVDGDTLQWHSLQTARALGAVLIEAAVASTTLGATDRQLLLSDGRGLRTHLLIAADGVNSQSRLQLGIDTAGHAYHQDAVVAHVRTEKRHANTAWQRFLPTGPLAFLPLADGRSSIVWTTTRDAASDLAAMTPAAFGEALTAASGHTLGSCELTTDRATFPLKLQYALDYVRPRAALIGDAAHAVHPLAGQGLNLGLLDCASLAQVLGEAGGVGNFGDCKVLRRYERWRRSENLLAATALDGLERLFSQSGALAAVRSLSLSVAGKLPWVTRGFARRALGLAGDVPDFLRA